jgi:hypothetical protein
LSNGKGIYLFAGKTAGTSNTLRRAVVAFDLSSIPSNATITSATYSMAQSQSGPGTSGDNVSLNRVLRDWGEGASDAGSPGGQGAPAQPGDATWLHTIFNMSFWTNPGGDFSPTASATTPVGVVGTVYEWSGSGLLADVQSWVSNPATNFGWIIRGNETDSGSAARFNSRENTVDPPRLTLTIQGGAPTPTPTPTATPTAAAQPLNLSTRMRVETGDNVGFGGFIITGNVPKRVLLRAIGPSVTGVPNVLADPVLELHGQGIPTVTNNNWKDDPVQQALIQGTGLAPSNDLESAIYATLSPGLYTGVVRGNNNGTGIALIEVYDLTPAAAKLGNISTRALVGTGNDIVIAGFILGNSSTSTRLVLRGIGPSLSAFGLPTPLLDPTLEVRNSSGTIVASNNDWESDPAQAAELMAAGLAPTNAKESGIALNLGPGAYTGLLSGVGNTTGVGVIEVYDRGAQ